MALIAAILAVSVIVGLVWFAIMIRIAPELPQDQDTGLGPDGTPISESDKTYMRDHKL